MKKENAKKEQYEYIFKEYKDMLYRIAFTHVKNHTDAEDAVQEVFVRLLRSQPLFSNKEHEKAWFIRTAINLCKDIEKCAWNRKFVSLEEVPEPEKLFFKVPYIEEDDMLWELMKLPEKYRDPLYLFYYEDYAICEISDALRLSENTVKTHLRRGREALKKQIFEGRDGK